MVLDLHVHTSAGSDDSIVDPAELVELARRAGLDGVCITEHGNRKSELAEKLARDHDFLVLGGLEASTERGDILVFGVDGYPRVMYQAAELRRFVEEAGGVMIAAHPFRSEISRQLLVGSVSRLTLELACSRPLFQLVDAMEVANGWTSEEDVEFCRQVSARLGLKETGGSDAHMPGQVGCCVTIFEKDIGNERELVAELKQGRFRAEDRRTREQKNPEYWLF